jgi:hypothetical protein
VTRRPDAPLPRWEVAFVAVLAAVLCTAPTVGDVGGCGTPATDLPAGAFAAERKALDCQRCTQCELTTNACHTACDPKARSDVGWPATCHPLQHDGDVCLRALRAASCSDYASFVDDTAPTVPTECDFCHLVPEAGPPQGGEL